MDLNTTVLAGSANPVFSGQDVSEASRLVKDITETQKMGKTTGMYVILPTFLVLHVKFLV